MPIASLLPPNATTRERAVASALYDPLAAEIVVRVKDPWTCPVELLPYLAAEVSLDQWSSAWPEELKRSAIARSWQDHRQKGTPARIDDVITGLGAGWGWAEWFEYGGAPYRFRVTHDVAESGYSLAQFEDLRRRINTAKNTRSIMDFEARVERHATLVLAVFSVVSPRVGELQPTLTAARAGIGVFAHVETTTDHE